MTIATSRQADYPIDPLFLERWSPRGYDSTPIAEADLLTILEAARWAPSAYNAQPWRFLYARRDTGDWPLFLDPLLPFNRAWAQHGAALIYVLSDTLRATGPDAEPEPALSHSFDAGAAWALLALQAQRLGFPAHGMLGVDFDRAREAFEVPARFHFEAAVAIGRRGDGAHLSESLRAREHPGGRKPLSELAFAGRFPAEA